MSQASLDVQRSEVRHILTGTSRRAGVLGSSSHIGFRSWDHKNSTNMTNKSHKTIVIVNMLSRVICNNNHTKCQLE